MAETEEILIGILNLIQLTEMREEEVDSKMTRRDQVDSQGVTANQAGLMLPTWVISSGITRPRHKHKLPILEEIQILLHKILSLANLARDQRKVEARALCSRSPGHQLWT